ncbi:MAG: MotA/TolQ/ExbB proton channel family protein [Elusimicrobia bacterium]|nr:MotA/TolQ/ExbB proton channel family protein [Elusimicrobiota bacterium]
MDLMTVLGIFFGLGAIGWELHHSDMFKLIFNLNAIILIYGGTTGSVLLSYPWSVVKHVPKAFKWMLLPPANPTPEALMNALSNIASTALQTGPESVMQYSGKVPSPLLEEALRMMAEGLSPDAVMDKLENDISLTRQRHVKLAALFNSAGTYSPIFGLLGTLLGVVAVLRNITDPTQMGTSMALAMTASFYGIFSANFIFLPVAVKLKHHADEEMLSRELIARGVQSILHGDVPAVVTKKLENFLHHQMRRRDRQAAAAG